MVAAVLLLGAALLPLDDMRAPAPGGPAPGSDPFRAGAELASREIHRAAKWTAKLPVELATPIVVRSKVRGFVLELPLPDDVRARVLARIGSRDFLDRSVPFLFFLKRQYSAPDTATGFDAHARSRFTPPGAPGSEHTLFRFGGAAPAKPAGPALDAEIQADLVRLYDSVFLQAAESALDVRPKAEPATIARTVPIVRAVLAKLADRAVAQGDIAEGLHAILADPEKLETITISLIAFVQQQAWKNYQMFARRVLRERELRDWMARELEEPGGGKLWTWLDASLHGRRYAFHVVVDGLQGHLVRALARGQARDPFVQLIHAEQHDGPSRRPVAVPSRPAPRQSTLFLDHFAAHGFSHPDYLPFFRGLLAGPRAALVTTGVSTTPTISVRNIPIAQTGAPVAGEGGTGIPNFHFVDRARDRAYYFYGNDALLLDELTQATGMRTLPERLATLNTLSCNGQYDRGAQMSWDGLLNLALGEKARDFGEKLCAAELLRRAGVEQELRRLRQQLLDRRRVLAGRSWIGSLNRVIQRALGRRFARRIAELEDEGMPAYVHYYNPWPDHFAHGQGPFSDEILAPTGELNRLDYWLARMTDAYRRAGVRDATLFGLAGDHGLTPVFHLVSPEQEVFGRLRARGVDFRLRKISSDEGEGPKMTHALRPPSMKGHDVVVASTAGGNYMLDFFNDQAAGWARQPLYADLVALRTLSGKTVDVLAQVVRGLGATLDYLAVREASCGPAGGQVRLVARRDERGGRLDAVVTRRGSRLFYRYRAGADDLLGVETPSRYDPPDDASVHGELLDKCVRRARESDVATWCDEDEWRLLASFTDRPDSVVQIGHLYDTDRAGTVNLFPVAGVAYNSKVPGRHAGEAFHEKDAFVGLWGEPVRSARLAPRSAVNGSVAVTIYEYLTGEAAAEGHDGWGYPSLRMVLRP